MIAAVVGMLATTPVLAQEATPEEGESEARMHFRLGRAYYDSGRFTEAAAEFELAYEQSQRPALLYNLYVAYRDAAQMRQAADALRRYLSLAVEVENRDQLEARLASMEAAAEDEPEPADAPPAEATPDTPPASPSSAGGGGGTWTPGWIIAGVGGAIVVGGVITGVLALDAQARLESEFGCTAEGACQPGFEATRDEGALLAGLTDGFLIGGAAIAATGVILALVLSDGGGDAATAGVGCGPEGCMGHVRGSF